MNTDDFYIILTAALTAICCALIGSILVIRKMAMLSDAISHAVLPGIVLAYLITGTKDSLAIMIGAVFAGVLSTLIIDVLHQRLNLRTDTSIGIAFTWLFALGVILLSAFAGQVDLDQECVLYGDIALVPFDLYFDASGLEYGPRAAYTMGVVLLVIVLVLYIGRKEFLITSFDESFSNTIGIRSGLWDKILMVLVSVTTVAAFDSVGAILVVALVVVPASAAFLLTRRLPTLISLAFILGMLAAVVGYAGSYYLNASISGTIAVATGIELAIATLLRNRVSL
jgi:manganese/zinc/iron transport system permease protein